MHFEPVCVPHFDLSRREAQTRSTLFDGRAVPTDSSTPKKRSRGHPARPHIPSELLKRGLEVAQSTAAKYIFRSGADSAKKLSQRNIVELTLDWAPQKGGCAMARKEILDRIRITSIRSASQKAGASN
jgi:hypothetical protein